MVKNTEEKKDEKVKCPRCGSTEWETKLAEGPPFGIPVCKNCGYEL